MKAHEANLLQFMKVTHQFVVPIYQRTYSWTREECLQLWNDIVKAAMDDQIQGHFIGSIVYIEDGIHTQTEVPQLLVIDGQQRLTTLTLLLAAIAKRLGDTSVGDLTRKKVQNYYLFNSEETGDLHFKLKLTQSDQHTLWNLLKEKEPPTPKSGRIRDNFDFFGEQLATSTIPLATLYAGIGKLMLVDISLDRTQDNPQLIFESLNSTGVELSQADLIRNYVLMGLDIQEQTEIYNEYWFRMEQLFAQSAEPKIFDRFMRDYLTVQSGTGTIPNIGEVYKYFKTHRETQPQCSRPTRDIVMDVYTYAKYFANIAFANTCDKELDQALRDINTLKVDVAYPLFLQCFNDRAGGLLSRDDLIAILRTVESYVIRRSICDIPTASLNKTFATLSREIDNENYRQSVEAILLAKDSYRRFPTDDEFRKAFRERNIYDLSKRRMYLLSKLENAKHKEPISTADYTVEHIMPQNPNLSPVWQAMLGPDWRNIQTTYLHTIGNLTLTAYNPELSDHDFLAKRNAIGGFSDSHIRLNADLAELDHWDEQTIQARADRLAALACQVWGYPSVPAVVVQSHSKQAKGTHALSYDLSETNYATYLQCNVLALFNTLRERILALDESVREEFKKLYIAYKTSTNFVDIEPQRFRLRLTLNMGFDELKDPGTLAQDITGLEGWGNGSVKILMSSLDQTDDVMGLIRQSFEKHLDDE